MDVKLVVVGGKHPGQEIAAPGPEFLIGRAPECRLRPNSDMVSRRHCLIKIEEGRATIRDLGSRNGTIVNGKRITEEHEFRTGDHIKVGPLEFEVQLSTTIGGKKKPKVHNVQEAAARTAQAARKRDEEPDIGDWLAEEEDDKKDTTTFVPPETQKLTDTNMGVVARTDSKIDPLAGPNLNKKPMAESSRAAAAEMLKQFFQRPR